MAKSPNTTTAPTGNIAPFGLRMLPILREEIEAAAMRSGRSMNAEIVARLEESIRNEHTAREREIDALAREIYAKIDKLDLQRELLLSRIQTLIMRTDMTDISEQEKLRALKEELDEQRAAAARLAAENESLSKSVEQLRGLTSGAEDALEERIARLLKRPVPG